MRRWLLCANRPLASFINELIGESWITKYNDIEKLEHYMGDREVMVKLGDIKHATKRYLQSVLKSAFDISIDSNSFLDIHCKRIHPYKRQVLHVLYILSQYLKLKKGEDIGIYRTHIFGGKASPSDFLAKQIIHLINIVVELINNDPLTTQKMHVVFVPNYKVSLAEKIIPAADLSEQISAANRESSGTSNIKYAINGAVTIASKNGANYEMADKIGHDTIFFFGHSDDELDKIEHYNPFEIVESNKDLNAVFSFLEEMLPTFPEGSMINPLLASLRDSDPYFVLYEFDEYVQKQKTIDELYKDRFAWLSRCLKSIARSSWFSGDRAVYEYSEKIWKLE
jgi:starch phosphorylase